MNCNLAINLTSMFQSGPVDADPARRSANWLFIQIQCEPSPVLFGCSGRRIQAGKMVAAPARNFSY